MTGPGGDEEAAVRVRAALVGAGEVTEIAMFGGRKFSVGGTMVCGLVRGMLVVRVGPSGHDAALSLPHARPMDFTGRPMRGLVYVDPPGWASDDDLHAWLTRGLAGAAAHPTPARSGSRKPQA